MEIKKFENFKEIEDLHGWVNVKIDNQIYIRMARYVPSLDKISKGGKYNLAKKIDVLSNIDKYLESTKVSLRDKISIIAILQYLKEIRDEKQFNPSSSGFLLEGFIATLIHGRILGGYGPVDITTSYNELDPLIFKADDQESKAKNVNYQIKLYKSTGDIKVNYTNQCDYYVICLKGENEIYVHILDGKRKRLNGTDNEFYYLNFARKIKGTNQVIRGEEGKKQFILVDTAKLQRENSHVRTLNVGDLDSLLKRCGENVQRSIKSVYDNLSELHYDIDAMLIGRDKYKKPVDVDAAADKANETIGRISSEIESLRITL